ncbi:MAG: hypothetical protein GYB64_11305, partial [Chloroflexi bacterium]|nr:hypothetical protein [Chloroflexota bacterium]
MRKVIVRNDKHVAPFNEPAHALRVLNKPLWAHQRDVLAEHITEESVVETFDHIQPDTRETFVYADNLFFSGAFIAYFLQEARERGRPCRAAFRASDPAFLQQGLRALTRTVERRGDLYLLDMWYFPSGLNRSPAASQTEPIIVESAAAEFPYYRVPAHTATGLEDVAWWVPQRIALPIETWVHVFFANVVFGVARQAAHEKTVKDASSRLRAVFEGRPFRTGSANVTTGENCHIDPGTVFSGNVTIGDNVTIGPGCVISECLIGDGVTLAHGNTFYMSVLGDNCFFPGGASANFTAFMENTTIGQSASLSMSVVGRNSYIGPGTVFSNTPLVDSRLHIHIDYEPVSIDMPVLGGCVGHNCRIGAGMVIYPGRAIESDVVLSPSPTRRVIMADISYE